MKSNRRCGQRYLPVKLYLILYREITGGVEIARVVHGAPDVQALMGNS